MKIFKNIRHWFKVQGSRFKDEPEPQPLRIEGVGEAPMTPEPDDAELAAAALLEHMLEVRGKKEDVRNDKHQPIPADAPTRSLSAVSHQPSEIRDAAYYNALADRIRQAHDAARIRTMRFVAFCEQELQKHDLPLEGPGSLGLLNAELMKRLDVIERVGGELKTRWQHCVAQVMVRLYNQNDNETTTDSTDN